ncbi:1,4-alpha-glucan branching protein GlgB [Kushneria phosphatilytica]|uniref:1,4-alpha-glucan branching enzyme GlgB n=2 Tax=Kushneria phosphatilytica TaxID=657387 RepID=A0A5C1A0C1_9GAMM|nr:1,4-alpha-glucan branching protein GlgB [Kushneria phosphatilytica]
MSISEHSIMTMSRAERAAIDALAAGVHGDPGLWLGPHDNGDGVVIRTLFPGARAVEAIDPAGKFLADFEPVHETGVFRAHLKRHQPYRLRIHWSDESIQESEDPYAFGLRLGDLDLHLFNEGRHFELYRLFGAQPVHHEGVSGVHFAVWAPNARRVSVVGDFNGWDGRRHPMRYHATAGVWELFVPRLGVGELYKFELIGRNGGPPELRADPMARFCEQAPGSASIVVDNAPLTWQDAHWLQRRREMDWHHAPLSIYELHVGSWRRGEHGEVLDWDKLAARLIPWVADLGFTHVELLPITEHPFGGSWGYQPLGMFAPSSRYGSPAAFARFVDACHNAGLGVILDWVPAHFPADAHGLAQFDGTALYEYADPREGVHRDWNTLIYNFGRHEVRGFLIASALYWIERFHIDGLRVDAVASMLYRDYSRPDGEWVPNVHGGRENLEAVAFLRELNKVIGERCSGVMTIAEESTAWPGVTAPVAVGGLGFTFKWNMGWMHDTLHYVSRDPLYRRYHHHDIAFGLHYAFSEHYVLPLSHDEVVHGKGALLTKMPGDEWQQFAGLRAYLAFMWAHPGKKLLFMGAEIGQRHEWQHDSELDWYRLDEQGPRGLARALADLNRIYNEEPALHVGDGNPESFTWVVSDDADNSVFAFLRSGEAGTAPLLVIVNFTPCARYNYRVGVPALSSWWEIFNSDSRFYAGSDLGNGSALHARPTPSHGYTASLELTLPPLGTLYLRQGDWPI